jgi:hypothetical protein
MRLVAASVIAMLVTVGLIQSAQAQGIVGASPIQGDFGRRASDLMPEPASIWPDLLLRSFFCGVIALCTVTALPASKWLDWGAGRKFCVLFLATAVPTAIFLVLASTNHQLVPGGGL